MAVKYTWEFYNFDVAPTVDNLSNVVKTVHWRLNAVDKDDNNYTSSVYGTVSLSDPDSSTFKEFSKLTKTTVQNWVESELNKNDENAVGKMKEKLADQIEDQKQPKIISKTAPWV